MRVWLLGLALVGCADDLEPAGTETDSILVDVSFEEHIQPKLVACTGCHGGEAPDGGFVLAGGGMYDRIVDVASGQSEKMMLVEPGNSDESYLWHKINGTQSLAGGAGTRMPLGERWSDEDIELLGLWIDLGALP